jgi:hypothetical protein
MIEKILDFIKNEPAAFGGVVLGLVQAILGIVIAFNVELTPEQQQAIIGLTTALVSVTALVAYMVRGNVTPTNQPKDNEGRKLVPEVANV